MQTKDLLSESIRLYLLGFPTQDSTDALEERLFSEVGFLDQVQLVESELVDAYVKGELNGTERLQFENVFLCTQERRDHLSLARWLHIRYAQSVQPTSQSIDHSRFFFKRIPFGPLQALAATLVLCCAVTGYLGWQLRVQHQFAELQKKEWQGKLLAQSKDLERLRHQSSSRPIISFILTGNQVRSSEISSNALLVKDPASTVRLEVEAPLHRGFETYSALIRTPEGEQVWGQTEVSAMNTPANGVAVIIPGHILSEGAYILILSGHDSRSQERLTDYTFTILR